MATGATGQLGLALPVQGELSGTWGDTVNNGITQYTNIAIAATLTLTNDGAVTLANTTGDASASNITSTLTGAGTVTAQFAIVRVTGTLTTAKVVTAPSYSKTYVVVNAATGGIVTFKASGQTGVSVAVGESAWVYYNGTDYVKLSTTTSGTGSVTSVAATVPSVFSIAGSPITTSGTLAMTYSGTALPTTSGGTGLTSFTSGGVVYASSTSALATGSAFTYDGAGVLTVGSDAVATVFNAPGDVLQFKVDSNGGSAGAPNIQWLKASTELMRLDSAGNLGLGVTPSAWATFKAFEVGYVGSGINATASGQTNVVGNAYNNSGWKYAATGAASLYQQNGAGSHSWLYAASGTAGNAISFSTAMTLDASGNLGVGTTSPTVVSGYKVIESQGSSGGIFQTSASGNVVKARFYSTPTAGFTGTNSNHPFGLLSNDTERFVIGTSGQLGIGLVSSPSYGTAGQVLTSGGSGAAPTWATAGGGSWTYLSTVTASGAATANVETTFDSTYDMYAIVVTGLTPSGAISGWYSRLKVGGSYDTTNYSYNQLYLVSNSLTVASRATTNGGFIPIGYGGEDTNSFSSFVIYVPNPSSTSVKKTIYWTGFSQYNSVMNTFMGSGMYTGSTSALTGVQIYPSSGTLTGTFRLYGIKNS